MTPDNNFEKLPELTASRATRAKRIPKWLGYTTTASLTMLLLSGCTNPDQTTNRIPQSTPSHPVNQIVLSPQKMELELTLPRNQTNRLKTIPGPPIDIRKVCASADDTGFKFILEERDYHQQPMLNFSIFDVTGGAPYYRSLLQSPDSAHTTPYIQDYDPKTKGSLPDGTYSTSGQIQCLNSKNQPTSKVPFNFTVHLTQ